VSARDDEPGAGNPAGALDPEPAGVTDDANDAESRGTDACRFEDSGIWLLDARAGAPARVDRGQRFPLSGAAQIVTFLKRRTLAQTRKVLIRISEITLGRSSIGPAPRSTTPRMISTMCVAGITRPIT